MKILIVEDDEQLCTLLKTTLTAQRYIVNTAADGAAGWDLVQSRSYDLILLDVSLPKLDGISFCRRLRVQGNQTLVLIITSRGSSHDKALGLDAGADDYVVKPIELQELEARIRALLRRQTKTVSSVLEWGNLRLDPDSCKVVYGDTLLNLTAKEYGLLELFLRNSQRIYSQSAILDQLWANDLPGEDTVRVHIRRLRQKLKAVGAADLIETVYGLGYRLNAEFRQAQEPTPKFTDNQSRHSTIIADLWTQNKPQLIQRVVALEQAIQQARQPVAQQRLQQECHQLIGTLGTLGLPQGSELMQQLELLLQSQRSTEQALQVVIALRKLIENTDAQAIGRTSSVKESSLLPTQPNSRLLIMSEDQALVDYLIAARHLQVAVAPTLQLARDAINRVRPDLMLLDLSLLLPEAAFSLLEESSPIPGLIFSNREQNIDRVALARHQSCRILRKPLASARVLEIIEQLLRPKVVEAKIMVLDDDRLVLRLLQALLETWGLQVTTLSNPAQFWQVLRATQPDLLILDVQMPDVDGIELCQQLREDLQWAWLPVVFLTGSKDIDTIQQIFSAGADDYVTKPLVAPELITRIFNRLERTRLLRTQAESDRLTNLPNRYRASQDLNDRLQQAQRDQQFFCLAVLEVDHLKQINRQYGHQLGDQILQQMSRQLRQAFRSEDIIARWDGAEFVIGWNDLTCEDGVQWLTQVAESLYPLDSVQITFSAGVAQCPEAGTELDALYQNAKTALEQAKQQGGNRVLP